MDVYVDSIYLRRDSLFQELNDTLELIYVNENYSDTPKDYLTDYEKIKGIYPVMITKWYNLSIDLAPIRNHLIKSLRRKSVFDYSDFVIVAHALEGYYIRFVNNGRMQIKIRYKNLFDRFSDLKVFENQVFNEIAAADSRNYYSHFFEKETRHQVLDGLELHNLYKQMRVLLICCILELIGIDIDTINTITSSSNSNVFK
ncbi:MAG: HEPN domain-containing protein [Bacteroidales bacterium]